MTDNIDDKIEQAPEEKGLNIDGEVGEELAEALGINTEEEVKQNPEEAEQNPEEGVKVPKPKDITDDIKDKVYDTSLPSGFEGEVAGVEGKVEVTNKDKELYLKAVLNDESVVLDIPFCNGGVIYKVRSKTAWEQTLAYEATVTSKIEEDPEELDYYQSMLKLQKMGATLQIISINNRPFSNLKYQEAGEDWTEQILALRKACTETIEIMDSAKLTLTLNALRIFEYKMAKMAANCSSGDFWEPAD